MKTEQHILALAYVRLKQQHFGTTLPGTEAFKVWQAGSLRHYRAGVAGFFQRRIVHFMFVCWDGL